MSERVIPSDYFYRTVRVTATVDGREYVGRIMRPGPPLGGLSYSNLGWWTIWVDTLNGEPQDLMLATIPEASITDVQAGPVDTAEMERMTRVLSKLRASRASEDVE